MADMIVAGAGTTAANGTYIDSGTINSRPYYTLGSGFGRGLFYWTGSSWLICTDDGALGSLIALYYDSFDDVATPDLATTWNLSDGDSPVPTVTEDGGAVAPTVTTSAVSSIGTTTATGNGNVTSDGGATITERGVCWNTSTNPTTSNSKATSAGTTGAYSPSMTGLTAATFYYVRAYAINSVGTSYGSEVTFTTNSAGATSTGFMSFFS